MSITASLTLTMPELILSIGAMFLLMVAAFGGDGLARAIGWGAVALHDIANHRHAEKALEAGVDGVIAVAGGAGGHTGTINPFALMNEVRQLGDHFAIVLAGVLIVPPV